MSYFEYELPEYLPYLAPELSLQYEDVVETVANRMDKLEAALTLLSDTMDGPTFAATAKKLWDAFPQIVEDSTAEELADKVRALYTEETPVHRRVEFPNAVTVVDGAFITTHEWEMIRHIGLGGSDSAVIQGTSHWTDPLELYYDKVGVQKKIPSDDAEKQAIFDRGHILEDRVIDTFCRYTGAMRTYETRMFRSKKFPCVTANPDEILIMPDGSMHVFEAKSSDVANAPKWAGDRVPNYYVGQCRQYQAVLDDERLKSTWIGCLFTNDHVLSGNYVGSDFSTKEFVARQIPRNEEEEDALMRQETAFWEEHVEPNIPPEAASLEKKMDLFEVYEAGPGDPDKAPVTLDPDEWTTRLKEYDSYRKQRLELEAKAKELKLAYEEPIKAALMKLLGDAEHGFVQTSDETVREVKWTTRAPKLVCDFEALSMYPDVWKTCVTETAPTRTFSIGKEKKDRR